MRPYTKTVVAAVAMTAAFTATTSFTPAAAATVEQPTLQDAVAALRVAEEDRSGYDRDLFYHWIDEDHDGCLTRAEVLIEADGHGVKGWLLSGGFVLSSTYNGNGNSTHFDYDIVSTRTYTMRVCTVRYPGGVAVPVLT